MKSAATILENTWKTYKLSRYFPFRKGAAADRLLLFTAISIAAFGLVMVYSASYIFSQEKYGDGMHYFNRHLMFLVAGLCVLTITRFLNFEIWRKWAHHIFFGCIGLMALTLIPGLGHRAGGASRWLNLHGFTIQPVEFAKIALVMVLASRLTREKTNWDHYTTGFLAQLWPAALLVFFCMLQPDFGSSALIVTTTAIVLYVAGVRLRYLLGAAGIVVPLAAAAMILAPYRRARLLTFLDPWADPQGSGFQIIQSFLAFYRGGLFGAGLGNSKAKIFYLPEAHNDFILSVVGEELGFLGIGLLSIAFLLLIFRGIRVAAKSNNGFGSLLAAGLTILLGLEVFWNAAIVLGLFPTKGMNLPFISSGGSSILCAMAIVGILLNISAQSNQESRR